jgi:hypothetical protein
MSSRVRLSRILLGVVLEDYRRRLFRTVSTTTVRGGPVKRNRELPCTISTGIRQGDQRQRRENLAEAPGAGGLRRVGFFQVFFQIRGGVKKYSVSDKRFCWRHLRPATRVFFQFFTMPRAKGEDTTAQARPGIVRRRRRPGPGLLAWPCLAKVRRHMAANLAANFLVTRHRLGTKK